MDQYIGKMLDNRYEILERIGTGGMAVVYKARCHRLNRLVAIKILKSELASDEEFLRRFQTESQAVAMLSHINIVSIYDVCRSDGLDYIVMELIDGMTLKQYMQKRGVPLNWREALHFITQIVRALGHAHSRGIVHRDIKPHNIMVLRDGSLKVTDFGIARLTSAAQATLTQEALGSVHYISPEQAKGSHVDGRSDLYSVGVMLYEMLTGRLPFEGETPVFVAIQHINSIPIAPRELNPEIPEALEAITMKAMAPNPDQRYASADELLDDLKEFRRNPGASVPQADAAPKPDEAEEPTMVIPVSAVMGVPENKDTDPTPEEVDPDPKVQARSQPKREKELAEEQYHRPRRRFPSGLIAVFAILVFLGGMVWFLYDFLLKDLFVPPVEYTVPDLRGYTVEDITNTPSLLNGFAFEIGPTIADSSYDAGQICRQSPAANETVREADAVITITISSGAKQMSMPDVTNMPAREALYLLQTEMQLNVKQEYAYSDTITKGHIAAFTPIDGSWVNKGDEVTIYISQGPEPKMSTVLPFVGVPIEQVRSQMASLNLVVGGPDTFYSDEWPAGFVMWQSIPEGTEVVWGTVIDLQVSLGPDPNAVPTVSPEPSPSGDIIPPTTGVETPTTVRTVSVDLTSYTGTVSLRILVGDVTLYDGTVDCSAVPTVTREMTGTGTQQVNIFVNDELVDSYPLEF